MDLDRWLDVAHEAIDAAGSAIRPLFRGDLHVDRKVSASPIVTEADLAAERAMRAVLEARTPEAGIEGEELGTDRPEAALRWVLDPIDGTIAFACGKPVFATLLALVEDGVPVIGIIDQPITGERWVGARGLPTTLDEVPVRTRTVKLHDARFATTGPLRGDRGRAVLDWVRGSVHVCSFGGDAYNYGALASGSVDLIIESGLQVHDWAALVPVVEGAGGVICDWAGQPLRPGATGEVVAAGSRALLEQVLPRLRD